MKRTILLKMLIFILVAVVMCSSLTASAATIYTKHYDIPYDTYTYWNTASGFKSVYSKPLYDDRLVIESKDLGVEEFGELIDLAAGDDGSVWLLDSEQSRITVLSPDYTLKTEIFSFSGETFKGAQGIYIVGNETVYVADTENARVLVGNINGTLNQIITLPNTNLIPDDFKFRPIKIAVDSKGYTYILSDGSYYGAILCSNEGEFLGFYGANSVESSIVTAIVNLWEKLTMTDEKRSKQTSKLPYQFTDLYLDENNFVYTATGKTKSGLQEGSIKMLSPAGTDILESSNVVFGEKTIANTGNSTYTIDTQNIEGLAVDKYGFIYTYDTSYGRLYIYDSQCNMICAFGGGMSYGQQQGSFRELTAIEQYNGTIFVADGVKNSLTVFKCSDYGEKLKKLQRMTIDGNYLEAKEGWQEVLAADNNSQFAYIGLAKAAYTEGDYKLAMELAKTGYDVDTYSLAFVQVRSEFLRNNFTVIAFVCVAVVLLIWILIRFKRKKGTILIKSREMKLFLTACLHPVQNFMEIKQNGGLSLKLGFISLAVFYITTAMQTMFGGFAFVSANASSFNSILLFLRTVGFVFLWTIVNWAVCTLLGGIGKMKEIFTVVTYALVPMSIGNLIYTVLTNFFVPAEVGFLSVITIALQVYAILVIVIGLMVVHDFSFGRFIGTALLTIFGIAVVIFVGTIIIILVQQLVAFFTTIYNEIIYK